MNLIYVDEVVVMTVDGLAYHYHHHPHHHPHQSPVHQQETFLFFLFPFSFFHFLLPLLFFSFRRARPTKPCPVSCDWHCDDGHILLFLYPSQSLSRAAAKQKSFTSGKEKSQIFVQFPVCHPSHIHGWECQQKKKNNAVAIIAHFWVSGWIGSFYFLFFLVVTVYPVLASS